MPVQAAVEVTEVDLVLVVQADLLELAEVTAEVTAVDTMIIPEVVEDLEEDMEVDFQAD